MKVKSSWGIAIKALKKNKLQTALTMMGMTIGVATVLTMIALGSGAEASIQEQVRSAGMNLIVVEGGNWSRGTNSGYGGTMSMYDPNAGRAGIRPAAWDPSQRARLVRVQGDTEGAGV